MVKNHKYDLTIDGVKDIADNVLTGVDVDFVVSLNSNDVDAPEIVDVEAVSKHVVRVTFNEPIDVEDADDNGAVDYTLSIDIDTDLANDTSPVGDNSSDNDLVNDIDNTGVYSVSYDDDDMVLEFYFARPLTDADVNMFNVTARDLAGNVCDDTYEFSAVSDDPEDVELLSWDQSNVKKFELQFSEKVRLRDTVSNLASELRGIKGYNFTPVVDKDDDTLWYLEANKIMDEDEELEINISSIFENYHGIPVVDEDDEYNTAFNGISGTDHKTTFTTGIEDEEEPYMEEVVAKSRREVLITFSEDMGYAGTYTISYTDDNGKEKTVGNSVSKLDGDEVTLSLNSDLEAKYVYTLKVKSQAKDLAGNRIDDDAEYDFVGTNVVAIANYIEGVKVINGKTFKVTTFAKLNPNVTTATLVYGANNTPVVAGYTYSPSETAASVDTFTFTLPDGFALAADVEYKVTLNSPAISYIFEGVVEDDITVVLKDADEITVSYSDSKAGDVVWYSLNGATPVRLAPLANDDDSADIRVNATGSSSTDKITIAVYRGRVVLYYLNSFEVKDAE
jgi:hypothetical protein